MRAAATRALGKLNDPHTIPLLIPLITDSAWSVRDAAMKALRPLVQL
jgi:HEAT repeat protein